MHTPTSGKSKLYRRDGVASASTRAISVVDILTHRESSIIHSHIKQPEYFISTSVKDIQISKLRSNLETAMNTAVHQRLENSKNRQQVIISHQNKVYLEKRVKQLEKQLNGIQKCIKEQDLVIKELKHKWQAQCEDNQSMRKTYEEKLQALQPDNTIALQCETLKFKIKDIEPLKSRIITLENETRSYKLSAKELQTKLINIQDEKYQLIRQLANVKLLETKLNDRIAYLERVNSDLQKKMQDYNRKENEYIKQVGSIKGILAKTVAQLDGHKNFFQDVQSQLNKKTVQCEQSNREIKTQQEKIIKLNVDLKQLNSIVAELRKQLSDKIQFYKQQGERNRFLMHQNALLQSQQKQLKEVISHYIGVSQSINLVLLSHIEQLKTLKTFKEQTQKLVKELQDKFIIFNKIVDEGGETAFPKMRQSFLHHIRLNNQLNLQVKQMKQQFELRLLQIAEERDILSRTLQILKQRQNIFATDQGQCNEETYQRHYNIYQTIFIEKTDAILLLESANDQLLKVKKDNEERIAELARLLENEKKENYVMKLKTADLFRVKKDLEESRKTTQLYQQMVQGHKATIADSHNQLAILRSKNTEYSNSNFALTLQKQNLQLQIKEMQSIMLDLDANKLQQIKATNQKNALLLKDSLDKLRNGMKSIQFYFTCSFCNEIPAVPVTIVNCGHTYCVKCKQGYSQICSECDDGENVDKIFHNKELNNAISKYKFLCMVILELQNNFKTQV